MPISDQSRTSNEEPDRYRLLVEAITDYAIYMLDPDRPRDKLESGSAAFQRLFGQMRSSASTSPASTRTKTATSLLPARALEQARTRGQFEAEGWRVRKDGSRFWAYVVIDPIRDASRRSDRLRQGHARSDRAQGGRGSASKKRRAVPIAGPGRHRLRDLSARPARPRHQLECRRERIKGYLPDEIIGSHFSRFYTEEDLAAGEPGKALQTAEQRRPV